MRRWLKLIGLVLVLALVGAACGDDDDEGAATEEEDGGGGETTTTAAKADCTLAEPVRLYFLLGKGRESTDPNALYDFQDGWEMAVDEINAAGGICGQQIEWDGPANVAIAGDAAVTDFQRALEFKPHVVLGYGSSSALDAAAEIIRTSGVPTLHFTTNPKAREGGTAASEWLFGIRVPNDVAAEIAATYAMDDLDACNIGLLHFNLAFGQEGADVQKKAIAAGDCKVHSEQSHDFNAQDLTNQVTAMDGADAVLDWGTPNTITLAVNTFAQQGLGDVPHITPGSSGYSSFYDQFEADDLANVYGVVDCNPLDNDDWAKKYEGEFDYPPSYGAAQAYDSAYLLKKVIEDAGSVEPAAIRDGLRSVEFTDGVCYETYKNDKGFFASTTTIIKFEDGRPSTVRTVEPTA